MEIVDYRDYLADSGIIVQIGAYDGITGESYKLRELILDGNFTCHLVEPQVDVFEDLQRNYSTAKSKMHFHNIGIYVENGEFEFYQFEVYSSFINKDKVLADNTRGSTAKVQSKMFDTFLNEQGINDINGLFLDVEGAEGILLYQLFACTHVRPRIIRYEHRHLENLDALEDYISSNWYTICQDTFECGNDRVAVRNDVFQKL